MAEETCEQRWVPLESNPDVLNKYIKNLGISPEWQFVDIYGLDAALLQMVPQPVVAVMLLYPITEKSEGQSIGAEDEKSKAYFVKQTIGNACGTIAIVHALANNESITNSLQDGPFKQFFNTTKDMSPDERAEKLGKDPDMGHCHETTAQEGQTKAPSADENVKTHFVAFVCKDGTLYELNGRCKYPIDHGPSKPESLLEDAAKIAKSFMERDPDEMNFTLMALSKVSE